MKASLSAVGYAKAVNVIRLEGVLRQLETFGGLLRDAENYSVTVFGAPDSTGRPGAGASKAIISRSTSPSCPASPSRSRRRSSAPIRRRCARGPHKGLRTLAREQDLGRALAQGMDAAQRRRMTISAQSLGDIVAGPGRGGEPRVPGGPAGGRSGAAPAGPPDAARRGVRAQHAPRPGRGAPAADPRGGRRAHSLRVGRTDRSGACPLLPRPRADRADRARQYAERRQPHPLGVARPAERLRRRSPARPLRARPPAPPPEPGSRRSPRAPGEHGTSAITQSRTGSAWQLPTGRYPVRPQSDWAGGDGSMSAWTPFVRSEIGPHSYRHRHRSGGRRSCWPLADPTRGSRRPSRRRAIVVSSCARRAAPDSLFVVIGVSAWPKALSGASASARER